MPIPQPTPGESRDEFISRCMGDSVMNTDFPEQDQRYAVCIQQLKDEMRETVETIRDYVNRINTAKNEK